MIPLDIYHKRADNKPIESKLEAWLTFLTDDRPERIMELITKYPEFKPMYETLYQMCMDVEKVMNMFFSEELRILDRNTVYYMIDEQQKELDEQKQVIVENMKQLALQKEALSSQQEKIAEQKEALSSQQEKIAEQKEALSSQQEKIAEQKEALSSQQERIAEQNKELQHHKEKTILLEEENARLKKELAELKKI